MKMTNSLSVFQIKTVRNKTAKIISKKNLHDERSNFIKLELVFKYFVCNKNLHFQSKHFVEECATETFSQN